MSENTYFKYEMYNNQVAYNILAVTRKQSIVYSNSGNLEFAQCPVGYTCTLMFTQYNQMTHHKPHAITCYSFVLIVYSL